MFKTFEGSFKTGNMLPQQNVTLKNVQHAMSHDIYF